MAENKKPAYTRPFPSIRENPPTEVTKPVVPLGARVPPPAEVTRPLVTAPLVTDGMHAHRREIERKKRDARREKEQLEEEAREGWGRVGRIVAFLVLLGLAALVYSRVQLSYGDRWPLLHIWALMALSLFLGIFWMLWYLNKKDM